MNTGAIKSYDRETGNGMITPDSPTQDVYFNKPSIEGGDSWVRVGIKVQYALYQREIGSSPEAKVVRRNR